MRGIDGRHRRNTHLILMEELESTFYTSHNPRLVFILLGHAPPNSHWPLGRRHFTRNLTCAARPYLEDRSDCCRGGVGGTGGCILAAHRSQRRLCLPALCGRAAGRSGRSQEQGKGIAALSGSHRTSPLAGLQVALRPEICSGTDGALGATLLRMSCALPVRMNAQFNFAGGCDRLRGMPPGKCG